MIEFERHPIAGAPRVGEYWAGQGGIYAGIMPDYEGTRPYHLLLSADEAVDVEWGGYAQADSSARSESNGAENTDRLLRCGHLHPAARWAAGYQKDGQTDFYLPSGRELAMAAASLPDQFSRSHWYWSSTEHSSTEAQGANFNSMPMKQTFKSYLYGRARAVRRLFVSERDSVTSS